MIELEDLEGPLDGSDVDEGGADAKRDAAGADAPDAAGANDDDDEDDDDDDEAEDAEADADADADSGGDREHRPPRTAAA